MWYLKTRRYFLKFVMYTERIGTDFRSAAERRPGNIPLMIIYDPTSKAFITDVSTMGKNHISLDFRDLPILRQYRWALQLAVACCVPKIFCVILKGSLRGNTRMNFVMIVDMMTEVWTPIRIDSEQSLWMQHNLVRVCVNGGERKTVLGLLVLVSIRIPIGFC